MRGVSCLVPNGSLETGTSCLIPLPSQCRPLSRLARPLSVMFSLFHSAFPHSPLTPLPLTLTGTCRPFLRVPSTPRICGQRRCGGCGCEAPRGGLAQSGSSCGCRPRWSLRAAAAGRAAGVWARFAVAGGWSGSQAPWQRQRRQLHAVWPPPAAEVRPASRWALW